MRSRTPVRTTLAALCRPAVAALVLCSLLLPACGGGGGGSFDSDALVNILTTSVPGGTTGVEYSANFDADFPHPPGKYAIVGGALPPGLVLDRDTGELAGFPRQ